MKKIIGGGILLFSGVFVFVALHLQAAQTALTLGGWSTPPGRLGTALEMAGSHGLYRISIAVMAIGFLFVLWGMLEDELRGLIGKPPVQQTKGE